MLQPDIPKDGGVRRIKRRNTFSQLDERLLGVDGYRLPTTGPLEEK